MRFLCIVSSGFETSHISGTTALQHCKLSILLAEAGGVLPPYRFNCLWDSSFHFQFHDLRVLSQRGSESRAISSAARPVYFAMVPTAIPSAFI